MSLQLLLETARTHPDEDQRAAALEQLAAEYGGQQETYQVLREQCTQDLSWRVREKALRLLSSLPQYRQTVAQLAVDRVMEDKEARVRSSAIELLPQVWVENRQSLLNTLSEWVRTSVNPDVRQVALLTLCETCKDAQVVLGPLLDRAEHDSDAIVRTVAVERLVDGWSTDAKVYQFLCDRAKIDTDPDVIRAANRVALPKVRVFFSYSHLDTKYAQRLVSYISNELGRDRIELWWDERISTGSAWDDAIKTKIRESDIALILVSQAFLNSNYCQRAEIQDFLGQRRSSGMVIFPIILSSCSWDRYGWLSRTQYLPLGGKNLKSDYTASGKREEIFNTIVSHLREIARDEIRRA
jgi:hypothetical protein